MSFVDFGRQEITFKIVYYGPPLSGKTTNLEYLHGAMPGDMRGQITMLSTDQDRTLYFDFLPLKTEAIKGFTSRFQLYTVPGQSYYEKTRQLVLTGADGVVFVADSQWDQMENNVESFANLKDNLKLQDRTIADIPYMLQFNKRDLKDSVPPYFLEYALKEPGTNTFYVESIAIQGVGVNKTLNMICKMVMIEFVTTHELSPELMMQGDAEDTSDDA